MHGEVGWDNGRNSPSVRTVESTDKRIKMGKRGIPSFKEKDTKREG